MVLLRVFEEIGHVCVVEPCNPCRFATVIISHLYPRWFEFVMQANMKMAALCRKQWRVQQAGGSVEKLIRFTTTGAVRKSPLNKGRGEDINMWGTCMWNDPIDKQQLLDQMPQRPPTPKEYQQANNTLIAGIIGKPLTILSSSALPLLPRDAAFEMGSLEPSC